MTDRATPTAVITGASRGLGRALALGFAREGYFVYGTARSASSLDEISREADREGCSVVAAAGDITDAAANVALAERIGRDGRQVDVLIHNAGLLGDRIPLAEYSTEVFERVLAANVTGPFDLTKRLHPLMRKGSSIHFVSSGVSLQAREKWGAYNISKTALDRLAEVFALELREQGIRVHIVDPGVMRTDMRAAAYPEEDDSRLDPPEARVPAFLHLARNGKLADSGKRFDAAGFRG